MAFPVTFEEKGDVGVICINRPEVHNVIDQAVIKRLELIANRLDIQSKEGSPPHVLVLTGAGSRTFCAGGDLNYFSSLGGSEGGQRMSQRMQAVLQRLSAGRQPMIAAVNGDAWGGGCEILTACHIRVAAAAARFGFRQAALGLVTGWGGGVRLFQQIGPSNGLKLLLTAETIDADEALRIGLIDLVVEESKDVLAEAIQLGHRIAANAPESIQAFLQLSRAFKRAGPEAAAGLESELFRRSWEGESFQRTLSQWERGEANKEVKRDE